MPRAPLPSESLALAESEGLLRFAAENVKDLPPTFVSTICAALDAQHASAWDQKIATEFWCAYNSLCTLIKPVTVDTLETNFRKLDPPKWHFWAKVPKAVSLSKRTATRYLTLLMVLLVVSVILGFMVSRMESSTSGMTMLLL